MKRAAKLNMVAYQPAHPVEVAEEVAPPPTPVPPPRVEVPPVQWTTKRWMQELVDKQFSIEETPGRSVRCEIYKVEYDRSNKTYVVSYRLQKAGKFNGAKESQTLADLLVDSRPEAWWIPPFEAVIEKYNGPTPQPAPPTPVPPTPPTPPRAAPTPPRPPVRAEYVKASNKATALDLLD